MTKKRKMGRRRRLLLRGAAAGAGVVFTITFAPDGRVVVGRCDANGTERWSFATLNVALAAIRFSARRTD